MILKVFSNLNDSVILRIKTRRGSRRNSLPQCRLSATRRRRQRRAPRAARALPFRALQAEPTWGGGGVSLPGSSNEGGGAASQAPQRRYLAIPPFGRQTAAARDGGAPSRMRGTGRGPARRLSLLPPTPRVSVSRRLRRGWRGSARCACALVARPHCFSGQWRSGKPAENPRKPVTKLHRGRGGSKDYASPHAPETNTASRQPRAEKLHPAWPDSKHGRPEVRAPGLRLPACRGTQPSLLSDPAGTPSPFPPPSVRHGPRRLPRGSPRDPPADRAAPLPDPEPLHPPAAHPSPGPRARQRPPRSRAPPAGRSRSRRRPAPLTFSLGAAAAPAPAPLGPGVSPGRGPAMADSCQSGTSPCCAAGRTRSHLCAL
ncbi:uncharacterized protein J5F26_004631 [Ciconia maguari]